MPEIRRRDVFYFAAIVTILAGVIAIANSLGVDFRRDGTAGDTRASSPAEAASGSSTASTTTTTTSSTTTTTSTTLPEPTTTYIDDELVVGDGSWVRFEPTVANATWYPRAIVFATCCFLEPRVVEINAGRAQSCLLGTLAIPDDQESSYVFDFEIHLDGALRLSETIAFGESIPVDLNIEGALRVKFVFTPHFEPPGGTSGEATLAIGNGRFISDPTSTNSSCGEQ